MDVFNSIQATVEKITYDINFGPKMRSGDSVESSTASLTGPGSPPPPEIGGISNNVVSVRVGPLSVSGDYTLDVTATTAQGDKLLARVKIRVRD